MVPKTRVAVIGGGIIGLTAAFYLQQREFHVSLFDSHLGRAATYASAGMIAPFAEITPGEEHGFSIQVQSPAAWKTLSHELEQITGKQLQIVPSGTLLIGFNASDEREIFQQSQVMEKFGTVAENVDRKNKPAFFTGISDRIESGLFLAGDYWIDPDQAVSLLKEALMILGVEIIDKEIREVSDTGPFLLSVDSSNYFYDRIVFCTGTKSPPLEHHFNNVVRPVRGTTVRLQGFDRSSMPMIRAIVKGRSFYYVCRNDGYTVIGATSEEQPSPRLEVGEMQRLLRDALDVIPALETAEILEFRSGVRPASLNGEPFEEYIYDSRMVWASGHYRHGVTLAPITAKSIADKIKP